MRFYKMISLQNDYLVCDYIKGIDYSLLATKICNRITGVGASGLLILKKDPFEVLSYNPQGEKINADLEMLGIISKYIYDMKYVTKRGFELFNGTHKEEISIDEINPFKASITPHSKASYEKNMMSMDTYLEVFGRVSDVNGIKITTYPLYFYGIHTIVFVDDFDSLSVKYKDVIANDKVYKKPSLIDFVKVIDKRTIEVKSYNKLDNSFKYNITSAMCALFVMNKLGMAKYKINAKFDLQELALELDKNGFCKTTLTSNNLFYVDIDDNKLLNE